MQAAYDKWNWRILEEVVLGKDGEVEEAKLSFSSSRGPGWNPRSWILPVKVSSAQRTVVELSSKTVPSPSWQRLHSEPSGPVIPSQAVHFVASPASVSQNKTILRLTVACKIYVSRRLQEKKSDGTYDVACPSPGQPCVYKAKVEKQSTECPWRRRIPDSESAYR